MPAYHASYRNKQNGRASALVARKNAIRDGRVIPDSGDLPIGSGRQFQATVMFLDICSFSARGSDKPEEQSVMLTALTILFSEMIRVIQDHGGKVEKNTGDGLMAYFSRGENGLSEQATALMAALTMVAGQRGWPIRSYLCSAWGAFPSGFASTMAPSPWPRAGPPEASAAS